MSASEHLNVSFKNQICTISLNRPEKRNALNGPLIEDLTTTLKSLTKEARVLILKGEGGHFCAGADLAWMQKIAASSSDENKADARKLAHLFETLYSLPIPTLAMVKGSVFGGGIGLVAACDIAIADSQAIFCFSEVKLGLTPSVIMLK